MRLQTRPCLESPTAYLRVVRWAGLGGRVMVGRGLVVVEERRVGQVGRRIPRGLHVARRLLERRPGVGVAHHHLRTAVAQRTVVVALDKIQKR